VSDSQPVDGGISRRDALKRGLLVGGALWVVPTVQVVTMTEAHAEAASGPASQKRGEEGAQVGHGMLPKTGSGLNPALVAAVGAGLVAAGSATVVIQRRRTAAPVPGDPTESVGPAKLTRPAEPTESGP